jgi:phosphoserine phosphatase
VASASAAHALALDPLPSWNNTPTKRAILEFVGRVSDPKSPEYVPPEDRIATFDNDGTLWSEKPLYFQFVFALDRVKALAPSHPEWKDEPAFRAALEGNIPALLETGEKGALQVLMVSHAGMTASDYEQIVRDWIKTARHPRFNRPYTDLVYQPMLELLAYLRALGFKTYVVSGGGIDFMRAWIEPIYGIPPEQTIGSSIKTRFEINDRKPVLVRLPEVDFVDDKAGKPVGIQRFIGRRPIAAFGNSDGDLEMLQYTTGGPGARFALIVHHTDAEREWAYDRDSDVGRLDKALDEAVAKGWTIVNMKRDWRVVYSFEAE